MTAEECVDMFEWLVDVYPQATVSQRQIAVYGVLLAPYSTADVRRAVLKHLHESRYFPTVADITQRLRPVPATDIGSAWREVLVQVRRVGRYGQPAWSHPALADAVTAMGWGRLCESTTPEMDRAHFMKFYEAMLERHRDAWLTRQLDGMESALGEALGRIGHPEALGTAHG